MIDTRSARAFSLACSVVGHSKHHWMVLRRSLVMVFGLLASYRCGLTISLTNISLSSGTLDVDTDDNMHDPLVMVIVHIYLLASPRDFHVAFLFYAGRTCHTIIPSQSFPMVINLSRSSSRSRLILWLALGVAQYSLFIASMCIIYGSLGYSLALRLPDHGIATRSGWGT